MAIYDIVFSKQAKKFLEKLTPKQRQRIYLRLENLPSGTGIIKMTDLRNRYRMRIGSFRVLYEVENNILTVFIIEIDNGGDIY